MRILFLQFRPDHVIADHEFGLVVKYSARPASSFVCVDTTREPLSLTLLDNADALVLGGSGDYLLSRGDIQEIRSTLKPFFLEARARQIPMFGICFGGQLMTEAFGGRIENDESRTEVGTFAITKTEEGNSDPLFAYLPRTFDAQLGHKDHITRIPDGAILLAGSERSPNQAWAFPGEPVYALTFHPELDIEGTMYRVNYYADEYHISADARAKLAATLRESPEANKLIERFLNTFVGEDNPVEKPVDERGKTSP